MLLELVRATLEASTWWRSHHKWRSLTKTTTKRFRMRNYLIGKDMWGFVTGAIEQPKVHVRSSMKDEINSYNHWTTNDKMVTFILSQIISNSIIAHIQDLETSRELWNVLERLYTLITKAQKIQLENELNNFKKSLSMTVNDYV